MILHNESLNIYKTNLFLRKKVQKLQLDLNLIFSFLLHNLLRVELFQNFSNILYQFLDLEYFSNQRNI